MSSATLRRAGAVVVVALFLAGCGGGSGSGNASATKEASSAAKVVPFGEPTGTPVLAITGARSGAEPVRVDYDTLDRLATREYSIFEPFEKKTIRFTGVDLATVLEAAGLPATAENLELTALDDYHVALTVEDVREGGIILATRTNGQPIPVDHGGPIRIVFEATNDAGSNPDQWIWSLSNIVAT